MRSSLGTRVRLHRCQPRFSCSVHSIHSQQISRKNLPVHRLVDMIEPDSLLQPLELLQLEVCLLDLSTASCTGLSCDLHMPLHPHSPAKKESPVHVLPFASLLSRLPLPFTLPFPSCLSLARCPSKPTSQEPCATHCRRRDLCASVHSRTYARVW